MTKSPKPDAMNELWQEIQQLDNSRIEVEAVISLCSDALYYVEGSPDQVIDTAANVCVVLDVLKKHMRREEKVEKLFAKFSDVKALCSA